MTNRLDWDANQRKQRGNRNGTATAYDELPPSGSWADQQRCANNKSENQVVVRVKEVRAPQAPKKRLFVLCTVCQRPVLKLTRHLRKAHQMDAPPLVSAQRQKNPEKPEPPPLNQPSAAKNTIAQLASDLKMTVVVLLDRVRKAGLGIKNADDVLGLKDKFKLLRYSRLSHSEDVIGETPRLSPALTERSISKKPQDARQKHQRMLEKQAGILSGEEKAIADERKRRYVAWLSRQQQPTRGAVIPVPAKTPLGNGWLRLSREKQLQALKKFGIIAKTMDWHPKQKTATRTRNKDSIKPYTPLPIAHRETPEVLSLKTGKVAPDMGIKPPLVYKVLRQVKAAIVPPQRLRKTLHRDKTLFKRQK